MPECQYSEYGMKKYSALTYVLWRPIYSDEAKVMFYATIKTDDILSMLIQAKSLEYHSLVLYDQNGNVLMESGEADNESEKKNPNVTVTGETGLRRRPANYPTTRLKRKLHPSAVS